MMFVLASIFRNLEEIIKLVVKVISNKGSDYQYSRLVMYLIPSKVSLVSKFRYGSRRLNWYQKNRPNFLCEH